MNLVCRMIMESPTCDRCQVCPEMVLHAFWSCREVDVVWSDVELLLVTELGFIHAVLEGIL